MQVRWYGQSAFRLAATDATVFVDPFAQLPAVQRLESPHFDTATLPDAGGPLGIVPTAP
jgi:L-ascorbate metabolism protein UlaG (beta-lactamase superfamily)